ncbi:MAG: major facilitator superfamily 1 [Rhodospirillales bacterium]|nr:major facilitator superfamily 1 [Rhodospirillales bacterium]
MAFQARGGFVRTVRQTFATSSGRVLALICLMYFITYVDRVNISTLAPLISKDLQLSNLQLGLALSAFGYPYALLQILGGTAADKFGPRRTLLICGAIWGVSTICTGFIGGLVSLIVARVAVGIGEGATFPAATRAMAYWVPSSQRGYAQGIVHSSSRLANAVTPPLVVLLAGYLDWRGAFIVLGCASLVWVVLWATYFRDNPAEHRGITGAELAELPPYEDKKTRSERRVPWAILLRGMLPTTIVYFCYNWTLWLYVTWLPSFFVQAYGLELKKSALFSFGVFAAGVVGDTLGGVIADRLSRRTGDRLRARRLVIGVAMLGSMVCLLPAVFMHDLTIVSIALGGAFFFLELVVGPIWAVPMDIAPKFAGTASGIMNTGSAIAGIISPFAFGLLIQLTGSYNVPFYGSVGFLFVGALLAFFRLPRKQLDVGDEELPAPPPLAARDGRGAVMRPRPS